MIGQLLTNWVCWAIVTLALVCYQLMWVEYLQSRSKDSGKSFADRDSNLINQLIVALPLFGLLGTIIGILKCFTAISAYGASGALVSGGIADALLTTQLALVCAVPAWLLQAFVRSRRKRWHDALILDASGIE